MTAPTTPAGLAARNLPVRFGGLVAVSDVDLDAPPGEITGLIGPNGAGKTTTVHACAGAVAGTGTGRLRAPPGPEGARRARRGGPGAAGAGAPRGGAGAAGGIPPAPGTRARSRSPGG